MATKIVMEALSPTMEEGRLVKWLKNEGDKIAKGDVLAEIETDKAVMELVARGEGVLRKRVLGEGETAPVGNLVGVIAAPDEDISALVAGAGGPVKEGEQAAPPADVVAKTEESAGASSVPATPREAQGEASTPPQQKTQRIGNAAPRREQPPVPEPMTEQPPHATGNGEVGRLRASPLARRLASESGLDLQQLSGSGPGGRIVKRDIEAAVAAGPRAAPTAPSRAGVVTGADYEDIALTQIRKTIARRLSESIGPIPTFYLTIEVDMTAVAQLRDAMKEMGNDYKVSYNDILMKSVATALEKHPEVNAHWLGDRIRQFNRVHLGMAVAIDEGLITPVIFDANRKGLADISVEASELAQKARSRKLTPEEYTGSTFSVSNLGMFGIDQFTAIINPPEVGIIAAGALEEKPVVMDGEVVVRKRMRLTMSCDHRVVDGATGAKFLRTLRHMLENPLMLVY
jgi:pyruvate dehydrogenase E2 component (dihydrolipoamide acetyltransferase)